MEKKNERISDFAYDVNNLTSDQRKNLTAAVKPTNAREGTVADFAYDVNNLTSDQLKDLRAAVVSTAEAPKKTR